MGEAVVYVEHDYTAQEPDELTIRKGDVIRDVVKKPGGWWEGTLRDKRGMFPDNFVTPIRSKPSRIRQCRAIFSYHPAHDDELNLSVGDVIDIVCEVEEGWWKGRLGTHEGVFPSNFVEEVSQGKSQSKESSKEDLTSLAGEIDLGIPSLPPKPTKIMCQAKYPYDACNDDELTLREGDLITLISKDGQDRGWWRGELHGAVGVFPDNFVVVLPAGDQNGPQLNNQDKTSTSKSQNRSYEDGGMKHTNVASQRKSLELKQDDHKAPPLPGKKPNVPKKTPSPANSFSGALAGLKQKMMDKVDGAASSRAINHSQPKGEDENCDFDHIERNSILPDMRANRARAPGRRPPSVVYRETDSNLVNGNAEHLQHHAETSNDEENEELKPKVREWEKHKAPWVEELKLNQAKRTPPSQNSSAENSRLKLTPTNDLLTDIEAPEAKMRSSPFQDKESSPVDMSKSMSALNSNLKTPTSESLTDKSPILRVKPSPTRPQSIHGVAVTNLSEPPKQSPSPAAKPPVAEKTPNITTGPRASLEKKPELISMKQFLELQERLTQMESRMHQQFQEMQHTIEDLKGKLQVETDMRRMLQAELEKVAQCVTQV